MLSEIADLKVTRNTITLREIVLDKLRDAIISTQLKPGQRLVERELCVALDEGFFNLGMLRYQYLIFV